MEQILKLNIIISPAPIGDVYFVLLPNSTSLRSSKLKTEGMYFPMHVVDNNSDTLYLEENKVSADKIKNNYYVALLFKDLHGKYWINDCNGLTKISQTKKNHLVNSLSYEMQQAN